MNEDEKRKFQVNHHPSLEHLDDSELSDALLDRLVDNELSEEEYRRVLALVSSKPDGWRQLAMAFLESQALEKELANLQGFSLDHFAEAENLDLVDSNRKEEDVDSRQRITEFADHTDRPNRHDPRSSNTEKDEENFHRSYSQLNGLARRDDVNQDPSGEKRLSDAIPASKLNSSSRSFDPTAEEGTFGQLKRVALIATSIVAACFLLTYFAGTYLSYLQKKRSDNIVSIPDDRIDSLAKGGSIDSQKPSSFIQMVSNESQKVQSPVINHNSFNAKKSADDFKRLTPTLQELSKNSGMNVRQRKHVMPIRDRNGNKIILPIVEIEFQPKNSSSQSKWESFQ